VSVKATSLNGVSAAVSDAQTETRRAFSRAVKPVKLAISLSSTGSLFYRAVDRRRQTTCHEAGCWLAARYVGDVFISNVWISLRQSRTKM